MYAKPEVGKQIKVTTRHSNHVIGRPGDYVDNVYIGTVLPDTKWTTATQFEMTGTEDPERIPLRQISLEYVIALEYADGGKIGEMKDLPKEEVIQVKGSKGNTYTVIKSGKKVTCTCPGFQFRRSCKHIKEYA